MLAGTSAPTTASGQCSSHARGVTNSWERTTSAAMTYAKLVTEPPELMGSSEQITTGESRASLER
jgi:hypothetical protein